MHGSPRSRETPGCSSCAELAGQWSDAKAQVADYTAAIESLDEQKPEAAATDLSASPAPGHAHLASQQWQEAVDDYTRVVTDATTDDVLLANRATAMAEVLLGSEGWTVLKPTEMKSEGGAAPQATGRWLDSRRRQIRTGRSLHHHHAGRLVEDSCLPTGGDTS